MSEFSFKLPSIVDVAGVSADYTYQDLDFLIQEAAACQVCAVSVNPCSVSRVAQGLKGTGIRIGGTVGFCLGVSQKEIKVAEAVRCVEDGAQELDMVMNLAAFLSGDYSVVEKEISAVAKACPGITLKIIIEVGFLSDEQVVKASRLVKESGAHFVKTMTGMDAEPRNRTKPQQVALIRQTVGPDFGVKASGGTRTLEDCIAFCRAGATRLGMRAQDIRRISAEWDKYFAL